MRSPTQPKVVNMLENQVIAHINNTQSTHNHAAQASASRVLILLRKAYSAGIEYEITQNDYRTLEEVIDHPDKFNQEESKYLPASIQGLIEFIDYIRVNSKFNEADRTKLFERIKQLSKWGKDHWTQNKYYSVETDRIEAIDSSLGETLNLVCAAIFDTETYIVSEGSKVVEDTFHRVESLFKCILAQSKKMCSGGRQHEFLFLLNGTYCPHAEGGKSKVPIQLIEDYDSFLKDLALKWLAEKLTLDFSEPKALLDFTRPWIISLETDAEEAELPYGQWLEKQKPILKDFLQKQSRIFGFSPEETQKKIDDFILYLEALPVPNLLHPGVSLLYELYSHFSRETTLRDQNQPMTKATLLLSKEHAAIVTTRRWLAKAQTYDEVFESLKGLVRVLDISKELERYLTLSLFVGEEMSQLKRLRDQLFEMLINFLDLFQRAELEIPNLPDEFEKTIKLFFRSVKEFKKANHGDFIKDFFAILVAQKYSLRALHRQFNLMKVLSEQHVLSDKILQRWLTQNRANDGAIEISPFEINLIILNAWIIPIDRWSELYTQALERVVNWLLEPQDGNSILNAIKETYQRRMLLNLIFLICLKKTNGLSLQEKATIFKQICHIKNVHPGVKAHFVDYFSTALKKFPAYRLQIFEAVQDQLEMVISEYFQLEVLINCEELSDSQRDMVLMKVRHKLSNFFYHYDNLITFLNIPLLNVQNHQLIWAEIEKILERWIPEGWFDHISELIALLEIFHLTNIQRMTLLNLALGLLEHLIEAPSDLRLLLECSALNDVHRNQVFRIILQDIDAYIKDIGFLLEFLRISTITELQCWQLLDRCNPKNILIWSSLSEMNLFLSMKAVPFQHKKLLFAKYILLTGASSLEAELTAVESNLLNAGVNLAAVILLEKISEEEPLSEKQMQLCYALKPFILAEFLKNPSMADLKKALQKGSNLNNIFSQHRTAAYRHTFFHHLKTTSSIDKVRNKLLEMQQDSYEGHEMLQFAW